MMAMMICVLFFPFSCSRSPNSLRRGLKTRAFIAGMKRARRRWADPIFVIGVEVRPDVPLAWWPGVTPAQAASSRALRKSAIGGSSAIMI